MIKLFRKIRYKMLNENKTSKYFRYAFGEIILVVIGILIALQINTWNENRKDKNEETKILKALQADFIISKDRIEETLSWQQRVLDYSTILINIHERQNKKELEYYDSHLDSLDMLISFGTAWYRAEPVTGAYNALISGGNIGLIKNEKLRHLFTQFAADLESGFEDQETGMFLLNSLNNQKNIFSLKIGSNKMRKRFKLRPRKNDTLQISKKFFENDAFFGDLYTKLFIENNRLTRQKSLLNQTNSILEIIDQELSKG